MSVIGHRAGMRGKPGAALIGAKISRVAVSVIIKPTTNPGSSESISIQRLFYSASTASRVAFHYQATVVVPLLCARRSARTHARSLARFDDDKVADEGHSNAVEKDRLSVRLLFNGSLLHRVAPRDQLSRARIGVECPRRRRALCTTKVIDSFSMHRK